METYKRYLLSSSVTFFSMFALVLVTGLGSGSVEYSKAGVFALAITAVRAGFKALGEWMVGNHADAPMLG